MNPPEVVREVVKPETAKFVATALQGVVSNEGTAPQAKIDGYNVAGKTGTAQKISNHGGYLEGRYIVSFAGFLPSANPKLMGLVIVDDAKLSSEANFGGLVAAPVFSKIGGKAARYLDLPLDNQPSVVEGDHPKTASVGTR